MTDHPQTATEREIGTIYGFPLLVRLPSWAGEREEKLVRDFLAKIMRKYLDSIVGPDCELLRSLDQLTAVTSKSDDLARHDGDGAVPVQYYRR